MTRFTFTYEDYPDKNWKVIALSCQGDDPSREQVVARFTPSLGCNLFGLQVDGIDYLIDSAVNDDRFLGTPILYPMPNRVRNAEFTFDGRVFRFPANNGTNFIHGLVRNEVWEYEEPVVTEDAVSATCHIDFAPGRPSPGMERYDLFPVENRLELTYTLRPDGIRLDFRVENRDTQHRLPFGLAIHPYFPIIGSRESVRVQVPAQKVMEAVDLLPTGKLLDMASIPGGDLREPTSLKNLDLDHVFWGLDTAQPQHIFYDSIGKRVTLRASDFFTYSVVYCPPSRSFLCVENQSCSTDAHNFYTRGLEKEASLKILDPGEVFSAWIEITVSDQ